MFDYCLHEDLHKLNMSFAYALEMMFQAAWKKFDDLNWRSTRRRSVHGPLTICCPEQQSLNHELHTKLVLAVILHTCTIVFSPTFHNFGFNTNIRLYHYTPKRATTCLELSTLR